MKKTLFYVGTYTNPILFGGGRVFNGKGEGIHLFEFDYNKGELAPVKVFRNIENPSFLVIEEKKKFLYAVNELKEYQNSPSGSVSSFEISQTSGDLRFINRQPTYGTDPCHVEVNSNSTELYVSNFMSGSVSVYPLGMDGSIGESSQFIQLNGSSVHLSMQTGPHAHSVTLTKGGKFALVANLGADKVMIYEIRKEPTPLIEAKVPFIQTNTGAGPRHTVFNSDGKFCYIINELDSTILVLSYNKEEGNFVELQYISTLPTDTATNLINSCADIHITPDDNYLYGSNRGHDSLAIYKINKATGKLTFVECTPCGGKSPRNFAIDPSGRYLICANLDSDNIVVFKINSDTGQLTEISRQDAPSPVCVKSLVL